MSDKLKIWMKEAVLGVSAFVLSVAVVALFFLGCYMVYYAFVVEVPWYSAILIISSLAVFMLSHWMFCSPTITAFWRSYLGTPDTPND